MAQALHDPLDEIVFSDPGWAFRNGWGCLHINSILHYFASSPFMDPTSNNRVLMVQAQNNQDTWNRVIDYQRFEATLRGMQGIEYVVTGTPQPLSDQPGDDTGIWVIRKQSRRKRAGQPDEVTTLGTYYVVDENIYQAPSVGDVLNHRLLTATTAFSKFVALASSLPLFTPSTGHTYLPVSSRSAKTIDPVQSRASTPGLDSQPPPSSQASLAQPTQGTKPAPRTTVTEARTLFDSLALSLRYGHEFMDENPLKGEPGAFHFSATSQKVLEQRLQRQKALDAAAAAAAAQATQSTQAGQSQSQTQSQTQSRSHSRNQSAAGTPREAEGKDKPSPGRKGSDVRPKAKRRKSKAPTSPSTPAATAGA